MMSKHVDLEAQMTIFPGMPDQRVRSASATTLPSPGIAMAHELAVLVVDDVPQICDFFRSLTRRMRTRLRLVTEVNARRAIETVRSGNFDVVVSDFRMPDVDGIDVLEEALRANPKGFRVLMTGYNDIPTPIDRIRGAKIDAYLKKPLEMQELQILFLAFATGDHSLIAEEREYARALEALAAAEEGT